MAPNTLRRRMIEEIAKHKDLRFYQKLARSGEFHSNAVVERFLDGVRRECLDHVIILGEAHLRAVLTEWVTHFNFQRPHQGIEQRIPQAKRAQPPDSAGNVVAFPVLSGLHHHYQRAV